MSIKEYLRKRDFKKTPEPKASVRSAKKSKQLLFAVQKHAASHLHYDFRLEMDGVLKSWAVPKGPSLDPKQKRLAMQVEDHPFSYAEFEGIIPKGQYGGGTVMLWDIGKWEPIGDAKKSYQKGKLDFILHGTKLSGEWHLVRMKADEKGKTPWLLIKANDDFSSSLKDYDVLVEDTSVSTHRTIEEIAANLSKKKSLKKLPLIKPQLATLVNVAPKDEEWLHEVKFDGYRIMAYFQNKTVKLITRNGLDWTEKYPKIRDSLNKLQLDNTIFDGEIVAIDKDQRINFQLLQTFMSLGGKANLKYFIFDLPIYQGQDLRKSSLIERKDILEKITKKTPQNITYSTHMVGHGDEAWVEACKMGLEGIISKRTDSVYESKRTKTWVKLKCIQEQEFVILGFATSQHAERPFASLLLGYYDADQQLQYAGHVGTGFNQASIQFVYKKMSRLVQTKSHFKKILAGINKKSTVWIKPQLIAQVRFSEWTDGGVLRHPSYLGLREDKKPKEVRREKPRAEVKKVKVTHPDKVLFADKSITKGELADYYNEVSSLILPHIINRPLMILRCPHGIDHPCFFQKHYKDDLPKGIYVVDIEEAKHKENPYIYIKDKTGVAALAQLGVIEMHPYNCSITSLDKPDRMTFDLDPHPDVKWKQVILAAERLRDYLLEYNLQSFVKTSGKKGLHIIVPLKPKSDVDVIKEFSRKIAMQMVQDYPKEYVATMSKAKRVGKIFIDYFRNSHGATSVAAYSCRANKEAGVSLPMTWKELKKTESASDYDLENTLRKLKKIKKDPWEDFFKLKQKI
ncbi:MAG: DNA ligase D [Pseudomonadota bacterium]|nr:DNA ligase D [Pseudomonadota bacterium]